MQIQEKYLFKPVIHFSSISWTFFYRAESYTRQILSFITFVRPSVRLCILMDYVQIWHEGHYGQGP